MDELKEKILANLNHPVHLSAASAKEWGVLAYWEHGEAAWLVLGLVPHKGRVAFNVGEGTWGHRIDAVDEAITRACKAGQISRHLVDWVHPVTHELEKIVAYKPADVIRWAIDAGLEIDGHLKKAVLDIADDFVEISEESPEKYCPTPGLVDGMDLTEFVSKYVEDSRRDNPGAQHRWGGRDPLIGCAVFYMRSLVESSNCKCNHHKLADIVYDFAKDQNGKSIADQDDDNYSLLDAIKDKAKEVVLPERILGNHGVYDKGKCSCGISDHQKRKIVRRSLR